MTKAGKIMADIVVKAAYASVVEDDEDCMLFVGFAEGEDADEPYALFRQPIAGGAVWFEVGDESFGSEDALASVTVSDRGLDIVLRPEVAAQFGWAGTVAVQVRPECEGRDEAYEALATMLGPIWQQG